MKRGTSKKRCPKCGGNMFFQRDYSIGFRDESYQWYGWCLQCGYTLYLKPNTVSKEAEREEVQV
jgi:predicted nucleic-acid-binding Zn-ribbon protein